MKRDLGSVNAPPPLDHRDSGVGWSCGPLVLDVMRNRIALGIIPGETYREPLVVIRPCGPDVNSHKQQAPSHTTCGCVDNCKKEFDSW